MSWPNDALVGIDVNVPRDTDAESTVGQVIRDLKKAVRDFALVEHWLTGKHKRPFAVDTGTAANTYAVELDHEITDLDAGFVLMFIPNYSNTGASTIAITAYATSLGAPTIRKGGVALSAGDLVAGRVAMLCYDGTYFELVNPPVSNTISASSDAGTMLASGEFGTWSIFTGGSGASQVLGALNIPINSYSQILVTGLVGLRNSHDGFDKFVTSFRIGVTTVSFNSYFRGNNPTEVGDYNLWVPMSHMFSGGQAAITPIDVYATLPSDNDKFSARLFNMRIYGY